MARVPGQRGAYQNNYPVVPDQAASAYGPFPGRPHNANWRVQGTAPQPVRNARPAVMLPPNKHVMLNGARPLPQQTPTQEVELGTAFWSSTPRSTPRHGGAPIESDANESRLAREKAAYDRLNAAAAQQTTVAPQKNKGNSFVSRLKFAIKHVVSGPVDEQAEIQKRLKQMEKARAKQRRLDAKMDRYGV